jgi:hypothetical protein
MNVKEFRADSRYKLSITLNYFVNQLSILDDVSVLSHINIIAFTNFSFFPALCEAHYTTSFVMLSWVFLVHKHKKVCFLSCPCGTTNAMLVELVLGVNPQLRIISN